LRIANRYHVFPTIDTQRYSVQVEASLNGRDWVPLDWRYAPDDPHRITPFIVPHQPRLDWQLWFVPNRKSVGGKFGFLASSPCVER
jgi:hypothetical protein